MVVILTPIVLMVVGIPGYVHIDKTDIHRLPTKAFHKFGEVFFVLCHQMGWREVFSSWEVSRPIGSLEVRTHDGSMYGIFTYIYHKSQVNVGKYTIRGSYGELQKYQTQISEDALLPSLKLTAKA